MEWGRYVKNSLRTWHEVDGDVKVIRKKFCKKMRINLGDLKILLVRVRERGLKMAA